MWHGNVFIAQLSQQVAPVPSYTGSTDFGDKVDVVPFLEAVAIDEESPHEDSPEASVVHKLRRPGGVDHRQLVGCLEAHIRQNPVQISHGKGHTVDFGTPGSWHFEHFRKVIIG